MKAGVADVEIERRLKQADQYLSRITLGKHKRQHLMTPFEQKRKAAAGALESQARTLKAPSNKDLAVFVRDVTLDRLEKGELEPSLGDGLRAQAMLDARAEKGADRDLVLHLAAILGGAYQPQIIEGEYREFADEDREDAEAVALLTAGN